MITSSRNSLEGTARNRNKQQSKNNITSLKTLFSVELKYSERVIKVDVKPEIEDHEQKDLEFVRDLLQINEHTKNLEQKQSAREQHMNEDLYRFVEQTGKVHYQANIYNDTSQHPEHAHEDDKCQCGCKRSRGNKLPYCLNIEKKYFFGEGIILFFYFNTRTLFLMFPILLIYGIFSLVTNITSNQTSQNCEKPGALAFLCQFKNVSEIQNKQFQYTLIVIQLCLGILMCFVWSLGMRLIKRLGSIKGQKIDDMLISASDYFIFLEKLPVGEYNEDDILLHLRRLWDMIDNDQKGKLKIKAVQIVYDMSQFRTNLSLIRKLADRLLRFMDDQQLNQLKKDKSTTTLTGIKIKPIFEEQYKKDREKIIAFHEQLLRYRQSFILDGDFRKKLSSECALVEFEDEDQKTLFLESFGMLKATWTQHKIQKLKKMIWKDTPTELFKDREIRIYQAPEPSDIFWVHCQKKTKMRRTIIVWGINMFCTACSFGFLYLLKWISSQNPQIQALSILSIIGINLFNRFIWNILLNIVFIEENYTKTINLVSVMNKSYISQLINIVLVPIILSVVISDDVHGAVGLAGQTHDFQITAFLFMTLFNLIYVPHRIMQLVRFIKPIRRFFIRWFTRVTGEVDTYEEIKEAVTFVYDPPTVPVAGLYVYITVVITQAFFFCHLNPILLFYLLGNLFLFFLINQYIVIRMCKITDMIAITVFHHVITLALNVPLLYGIASILILLLSKDQQYHFGYYVPSIFCFIIWFLSIQSPFKLYRKLIDCILANFIKQKSQSALKKARQEKKNNDEKEPNEKAYYTIADYMESAEKLGQDKSSKKTSLKDNRAKRMQNYYGAIGTNQIFNMENKLQEVKGTYHGGLRQFCQSFNTEKMDFLYYEYKGQGPNLLQLY